MSDVAHGPLVKFLIPCLLALDRFCSFRGDKPEFCTMGGIYVSETFFVNHGSHSHIYSLFCRKPSDSPNKMLLLQTPRVTLMKLTLKKIPILSRALQGTFLLRNPANQEWRLQTTANQIQGVPRQEMMSIL